MPCGAPLNGAERRCRPTCPLDLTDDFVAAWAAQWRAFLGRERMAAAPETFAVVVANLRSFLNSIGRDVRKGADMVPSRTVAAVRVFD